VHSTWDSWLERVLDVVIYSEISLDQAGKIFNDLTLVLLKQSLELAHILKFVEVLLKFSIKVQKDFMVLLECHNQLLFRNLVGVLGSQLQLTILL